MKPPLVLIVDDEKAFRLPLRTRLRLRGYETVTAVDGEEAWVVSRDLRPDVILLDLKMAGVDGVQFLRRLRNDPDLARTPVIVVTALCDSPLIRMAEQIGVQDLMLKTSFDLDTLLGRVAGLIRRAEAA